MTSQAQDRRVREATAVYGREEEGAFFAFARRVVDAGRLREEALYVQHGTTSTLLHSLAVAHRADGIARGLGLGGARLVEIRRAGLLHDYYLYDWHTPEPWHRLHGLRHPGFALRNARRDYPDLTLREADAIVHHMFPLTPLPPHFGVGWVVTLADKLCASYETGVRGGAAYPDLRELAEHHLPGLELGPVAELAFTGPTADAQVPALPLHARKACSA